MAPTPAGVVAYRAANLDSGAGDGGHLYFPGGLERFPWPADLFARPEQIYPDAGLELFPQLLRHQLGISDGQLASCHHSSGLDLLPISKGFY